ncbi:transcriptional regulator, ArsR family [Clostridium aceticum]|uniref:Transcriptional regulator, ArsR family n=1 Tax=Clostridium aceticum TaxID=84022 RepID=A0A0D8IBH4_9CLOT|nr:metalloregulator ArsR/SmtB family transcription factor [Clostridium aceticum]AKL96960.1 transcriptional regulator, ArsR family [Clostridium aceticum]KJF27429.1 ArsR family transcriptional regulator [Clostridium aceticum]
MKKDIEICEVQCIHEEDVKQVKEKMLEDTVLNDMAEFFKVFGDVTRIKILSALFQKEMCVCDIAAVLDMNQSAISHQLRLLKSRRLVKFRREGKVIYYSLDDAHIKKIFNEGLHHIQHS